MDIAEKVTLFDSFHSMHKARCGGGDLDVSMDRPESDATSITLTCPLCRKSVTGSFADADIWQVTQLLGKTKGGN